MLTNQYKRVHCSEVKIARDERHRRHIDTGNLIESIRARGVINPIIIDKSFNLIAGERRLTASKELGLPDIPARFVEDLTPAERQIIELEENIKRSDLSWDDECKAILRLHRVFESLDSDWTYAQTAQEVGLSSSMISMNIRVAEEMEKGNRRIVDATTLRQAYNTLSREDNRRASDAVSDLITSITAPIRPEPRGNDGESGTDGADGSRADAQPDGNGAERLSSESILCSDFREWAKAYTGPRFNLIHCDFPYGVNLQKSAQANTRSWGGYQDTPDTYWELLTTLAQQQDRLCGMSCHIMFWFSMSFYEETLEFFDKEMPEWEIQPFPLVWFKSDNKGILPDPKRGPRRVYETAFIGSRGDRHIVKAVANAYACPTSKTVHQSEKPEPMLRHFFQMFVDEHTRLLDPTCGGGSALRAAESLGADIILGLEQNPEFCEAAKTELKRFRALRSMSNERV